MDDSDSNKFPWNNTRNRWGYMMRWHELVVGFQDDQFKLTLGPSVFTRRNNAALLLHDVWIKRRDDRDPNGWQSNYILAAEDFHKLAIHAGLPKDAFDFIVEHLAQWGFDMFLEGGE